MRQQAQQAQREAEKAKRDAEPEAQPEVQQRGAEIMERTDQRRKEQEIADMYNQLAGVEPAQQKGQSIYDVIGTMLDRKITDPNQIAGMLNFDSSGRRIANYTPAEIAKYLREVSFMRRKERLGQGQYDIPQYEPEDQEAGEQQPQRQPQRQSQMQIEQLQPQQRKYLVDRIKSIMSSGVVNPAVIANILSRDRNGNRIANYTAEDVSRLLGLVGRQ